LRTVQFWLEQNARMLGATIQALEVQRMTLSTLKSMNVPLTELSNALKLPNAEAANPAMPPVNWPGVPPEILAAAAKAVPTAPQAGKAPTAKPAGKAKAAEAAVPGAVDPLQWWGALSQQFTQLAATAMKDSATDAAKNLAGAIVKQSFDAAGETLRKAASVPGAMAKSLAPKASSKTTANKPALRTAANAKPAAKRKS